MEEDAIADNRGSSNINRTAYDHAMFTRASADKNVQFLIEAEKIDASRGRSIITRLANDHAMFIIICAVNSDIISRAEDEIADRSVWSDN